MARRTHMTTLRGWRVPAVRSGALARLFLVAGFAISLSAAPASAQKKGGSITMGLELDIPGFDPLKSFTPVSQLV